MQTSRILRTSLASAVLGLGAVTAVAATAEAAPASTGPAAAASAAQHTATAGRTQTLPLSDGSTAHVTRLANHTYQAWITHKGVRIAALDSAHKTQRVHGYTYALNQANGFVGVVHPGGWHSEQNVPQHPAKKHTHHKNNDHKNNDHQNKHHKSRAGKTHDVRLADGATAHVTKLANGTYQAWINRHGVRIAALDAGHSTARAHGHHYTLNAHTGAVHLR
ncbi:hypothetical protein OG746_45260 [Streptomyces sp. NBC_01016]|uniref:hypothetical protein n=1 Tax=Streptomyces sp. NBC_01016 TaxID=2903720 RepID=UPI00224FDA02|nr:hypothetical protein [Streptomyces sp. NBC_01016]MCX4832301.1 hypothetical protein [Streptomyces sp. NBC_01016]MCX4835925.1 hypothetical protein [Streptomyces sp. NBC_01016]